jgi:hypothetical protein
MTDTPRASQPVRMTPATRAGRTAPQASRPSPAGTSQARAIPHGPAVGVSCDVPSWADTGVHGARANAADSKTGAAKAAGVTQRVT